MSTKFKSKFKLGKTFGKWKLIKFINAGGNGEVWSAKDKEGNNVAIKCLIKIKSKAYSRFKAEVHALKAHIDTKGVMPIIDSFMPDKLGIEVPWYVMSLCSPIEKHFLSADLPTIINAFISLAETLDELHSTGFSHRDIKPGNILIKDGQILLADFGLVNYPKKEDVTLKGESVGPKWTMAPEMKRNAEKADGIPADIYSLAKTLWISIIKETKGFEGQYVPDDFIGLKKKYPQIYSNPLDELLSACTNNNPDKRPSAKLFKSSLLSWIELNEDWKKRNPAQWIEVQNDLFPFSTPQRASWEKIDDIVYILNKLGSINSLNHMFFPSGGGADLASACYSNEKDCIEVVSDGTINIIKPKKLLFESFGYDYQWNYFRLEAHPLAPSGVYDNYRPDEINEPLTEVEPAVYAHYKCKEFDDLNGASLPKGARYVCRFLKGSFVLFQKSSYYNKVPYTYDAFHQKYNEDEFRLQIQKAVDYSKKRLQIQDVQIGSEITIIKSTSWKSYANTLTPELVVIIKKTMQLAKESRAENERLNAEHGDDMFSRIQADSPAEDRLTDYLHTLGEEELITIEAVMYAGRHYGSAKMVHDLDAYKLEYSDRTADDIAEKMCLDEYLKEGLSNYI